LWIADPATQYVDEIQALSDTDLYRVRSVPGIEWAVPFYKSLGTLKTPDGRFRSSLILGLDDATLVGAPQKMILGRSQDLSQPNAIVMDKAGYIFFFGEEKLELGKTFELNDRRAVLVGICDAAPPFQTIPVIYAKYSEAVGFTGLQRRKLSFILAKTQPGIPEQVVCEAIESKTGLKAFTQEEFIWKTIFYYMANTGIPINFGLTISIAILVGMVVAGQTFSLFILDNIRAFATLKAMGVSHRQLIYMVLTQAMSVGLLGYCFGMGLAGLFFSGTESNLATRGLVLLWQAMGAAGVVILLIISVVSTISLRKVLKLEPASVFR